MKSNADLINRVRKNILKTIQATAQENKGMLWQAFTANEVQKQKISTDI